MKVYVAYHTALQTDLVKQGDLKEENGICHK